MLSRSIRRVQQELLSQARKATVCNGPIRQFSNQHERETNEDNQIRSFAAQDSSVTASESHLQFSKAPIIKNFGELPAGEIPEPLKYNRPFQSTTLSNGIRVCTERSSTNTATVGVFVGAGSRQDTIETSGTAHLTRTMLARGTSNRSKADFAMEVEQMGGHLHGHTDREHSAMTLCVLKDNVPQAIELLGDAFSNANFDSAEVELTKAELADEAEMSCKQHAETILENSHYNSFRDHMIGQPIKGDRDNNQNLSVDGIQNFRAANYFGDNIVVVGTGNVSHDQLVDQVNQHFGAIAKTTSASHPNTDKPWFNPSLLYIRDDEMVNSNVGVFYDAPSVTDPDYYSFLLLKNMFGQYRIDKHAEHLNDVKKQYNSMHALLGDLPDVTHADAHFMSYSDCGMFGNTFFGNEVFTRQMNYCGVCLPTIYAHFLNDVEVIRGRNTLYNTLMNGSADHSAVNSEIGTQMIQQGRRVPRSEVAKRVAHIDAYHMKGLANKWFYDAEPTFTNWGPIETVSCVGSYKYFKVNTMSTVTNAHHSLFN